MCHALTQQTIEENTQGGLISVVNIAVNKKIIVRTLLTTG